ncbi:MAG TPA: hypothetical protein VJ914_24480 [Pseudonocardiaceae bacterium]|nr:hypothetical protein [Pseudonocardiaceae bacterium]
MPQTINVGDDVVLTVNAQDGQYHINAAGLHTDPWPTPTATLFGGDDNWIAVLCGTEYGPITVRVRYLGVAPSITTGERWDMIGERDLVQDPGDHSPTRWGRDIVVITEIYSDVVAVIAMPPGRYRMRVHVRGRQEAHQRNDPLAAIEEHSLVFWRVDRATPPETLTDLDEYGNAILGAVSPKRNGARPTRPRHR